LQSGGDKVSLPSNLYVVIHNVYSITKLYEAARISYGMGVKTFIISKAVGSAAQEGVPDVQKLALKLNRNMLYLADLNDVIDVLKPDYVYVFVRKDRADQQFNPDEIAGYLIDGKKVVLVFGGAEPGLTRKEIEKGIPIYIDGADDVGSLGQISISLYEISKALKQKTSDN